MKVFKFTTACLMMMGLLFITSCGDDEDPMMQTGDAPISSFQFEIDDTDFLKVTFSNFSQDGDSFSWDFGDGNNSTDKDPVHTYDGGGDYTVSLTATNTAGSHTSMKDISITDPNDEIKKITGDNSKVWKLSRNVDAEEYPIIVGNADKTEIWWGLGFADPIGVRPCTMEEEFVFGADGSFTFNAPDGVWADVGVWNTDVEATCIDGTDANVMTGPNGEDLSAWGPGTFTFDFDAANSTLTVTGLGAHVGLAKVGTTAEYTTPQTSVTYKVTMLDTEGSVDKMVLETDLVDAGGYWQFFLVSYDDPNDEPELPGAAPQAWFTHEVDGSTATFTNNTTGADSYSWDFGDGEMSTEESPVHTYASDGSYNVIMTATNGNGSAEATANVLISSTSFSADVFTGETSKSWRINAELNSMSVGPFPGSTEWFTIKEEDLAARTCTFDDTYTFGTDGVFEYNTNGDLWGESYMGGIDPGCYDEADLPAEAAAWGSGTHMFTVTEATDTEPAYISVTGTGAFIALAKAYNGGEYSAAPPVDNGTVTYEVMSYVDDGTKEVLVLLIDISEGEMGTGYWTFTMVSE